MIFQTFIFLIINKFFSTSSDCAYYSSDMAKNQFDWDDFRNPVFLNRVFGKYLSVFKMSSKSNFVEFPNSRNQQRQEKVPYTFGHFLCR